MKTYKIFQNLPVRIIGGVLLTATFPVVEAGEFPRRPFEYRQDFEKTDPMELISSRGSYTVNFRGLTSEKAAHGEKSYKIDVTFNEANTSANCHWGIPLRVPGEGSLKLRCKIFVAEASPRTMVGIEFTSRAAPTDLRAGHGLYQHEAGTGGAWQTVEADILAAIRKEGPRTVQRGLWKANADHVGFYIQNVFLRLRGMKTDRVVLYLDDLEIEGDVPDETVYQLEIDRRWAPVRELVRSKVEMWNPILAAAQRKIEAVRTPVSPEVARFKDKTVEQLRTAEKLFEPVRRQGYIHSSVYDHIDQATKLLAYTASNLEARQAGQVRSLIGVDCYVVAPTSGIMILPESFPIPGELSDTIAVAAARGEYEPASFVLRPKVDLSQVRLEVSDLRRGAATIASSRVDAKVVKCWYQSEGAWTSYRRQGKGKVLVPDLLLNDDTLVRVDRNEKNNYLKLRFPHGDKYVWIDDPAPLVPSARDAMAYYAHAIDEFPVKDDPSLGPVDIPGQTNKQFWLTIHVPEDADPGSYEGTLTIRSAQGLLGNLRLRLRVLPFELSDPTTYYDPSEPFVSSIYCEAELDPREVGTIGSSSLNEQQFRRVIENLYAHGVTNPIFEQGRKRSHGDARLRQALQIRRDVGMRSGSLYWNAFNTGNPKTPEALGELRAKVRWLIDFVRPFGITDVYVYGIDEATGERLKSQRPAWEAVHEAGAKVFVAGSEGTFEAMGDLLDIANWSGIPDLKEAAKWHRVGHKIWNYGNPQAGVENPQAYRRNFGLLLWKSNYDGAATWAYQSSYSQGIWHDFNCNHRSPAFALPTVDGVIDTIAWEGYREGIDDIRYGSTLKRSIEKALSEGNVDKVRIARAADRYLEELDVTTDLGVVREEIISYILKLISLDN